MHDREGHERLQIHQRRRDEELEDEVDWAPVARENDGDPALVEQQDVESASVERGSDAVADNEERARLRLRAEGKRSQEHDIQHALEPLAKTKARLEPRKGPKRESTQPLADQEEEVTSTVPVVSGFAPMQRG